MCRKFNDLNLPSVSFTEVDGVAKQDMYCEASLRLERCDRNCEECVYHSENLDDFLDYYDKQMCEVL